MNTLAACASAQGSVEEISSALTERADDLHELAAADRNDPHWDDICFAIGSVRNSAVVVWSN